MINKKNINVPACALMLKIALVKIEMDFYQFYEKLPEDPGGPEVTFDQLKLAYESLVATMYEELEELIREPMPDVVIPDEPEEPEVKEHEELIGTYSMKPYTRTPGNEKSAGRVPRDFQKHDYPVKFVFNNDCGEFVIPTAKEDFLDNGKEHYAYLKWEKGSPVVFTKAGCVAGSVTAYKI